MDEFTNNLGDVDHLEEFEKVKKLLFYSEKKEMDKLKTLGTCEICKTVSDLSFFKLRTGEYVPSLICDCCVIMLHEKQKKLCCKYFKQLPLNYKLVMFKMFRNGFCIEDILFVFDLKQKTFRGWVEKYYKNYLGLIEYDERGLLF